MDTNKIIFAFILKEYLHVFLSSCLPVLAEMCPALWVTSHNI